MKNKIISSIMAIALLFSVFAFVNTSAQAANPSMTNAIINAAQAEFKKPHSKSFYLKNGGTSNGNGCCTEFANYCVKIAIKNSGSKIKWQRINDAGDWHSNKVYKKYTTKAKAVSAYSFDTIKRVKPGDILASGHSMVVTAVDKNRKWVEVIEGNPGSQKNSGMLVKNSKGKNVHYLSRGILYKTKYKANIINKYKYIVRFK